MCAERRDISGLRGKLQLVIALVQVEFTEDSCLVEITNNFLDGWRDVAFTLYRLIGLTHIYTHADFPGLFGFGSYYDG